MYDAAFLKVLFAQIFLLKLCMHFWLATCPAHLSRLDLRFLKKQLEAAVPIQYLVKLAALVPEFAVEDLPSEGLEPRFLPLHRRTCPWIEHSDDDELC